MLVLEATGVLEDGSSPRPQISVNPRKTLRMQLGADFVLNVTVRRANGTLVDLTGGTLLFTLKKKPTDDLPLISRAASVGSARLGALSFTFAPSDTKNLSPGAYAWDVWFTDSGGKRAPIIPVSPFILEAAATRVGQVGTP